jgi:hypothetical protein
MATDCKVVWQPFSLAMLNATLRSATAIMHSDTVADFHSLGTRGATNGVQEELRQAAEKACGAGVTFDAFFHIIDRSSGKVRWDGIVNQYKNANDIVYVWAVRGDEERKYVAVLRKPPVETPMDAVRAWLDSRTQR